MSTGKVVIVGGGGAQGLACATYLRGASPDLDLIAVDLTFSRHASKELNEHGIGTAELDVLAEPDRLLSTCKNANLVVNAAGPFFRIGTAVLDAAIGAGADYLDICDDIDATELLLQRHQQAADVGITAIIGMGAAPGTTNLLVAQAIVLLSVEPRGVMADIAWCAPSKDLTFGIFAHLVHCFRTALKDGTRVPDWDDLQPSIVTFPDPIGPVEVTLLGHPEPLTLPRYLGCATRLRGGMTEARIHHLCWDVARAIDNGMSVHEAWNRVDAARNDKATDGQASGMLIDVTAGEIGVRFATATNISMEQSTAVPAAAGATMLLNKLGPGCGVWPPEMLSPVHFFEAAHSISPGGGGLKAWWLRNGEPAERLSMRELFAERRKEPVR